VDVGGNSLDRNFVKTVKKIFSKKLLHLF